MRKSNNCVLEEELQIKGGLISEPVKLRVLNLYCGIGGNRRLWNNVEVTAVELDLDIANEYKKRFPNDKIVIGDAHKYLLEHYEEFDFIWSSPPCQTHSRINRSYKNNNKKMRYPDMKLYQEIIFLNQFFDGKYCVENVIPYYEPLIYPITIGRHCFWSNFDIPLIKMDKGSIGSMNGKFKKNWYANKSLTERNAVDCKLGLHIFNCAFKETQQKLQFKGE